MKGIAIAQFSGYSNVVFHADMTLKITDEVFNKTKRITNRTDNNRWVSPFRTGRPSKAVTPKMGEETEGQQKELAAKEVGAAIPTHPHAAAGDASPRMSSTSKKLFLDLVESSPVSVHRHEDPSYLTLHSCR